MAQDVVRKLDDEVKERLRQRAARHGWSMEEEIRDILRDAVKDDDVEEGEESDEPGLGTRIAQRFAWLDEPFEIPELRGSPDRTVRFEE